MKNLLIMFMVSISVSVTTYTVVSLNNTYSLSEDIVLNKSFTEQVELTDCSLLPAEYIDADGKCYIDLNGDQVTVLSQEEANQPIKITSSIDGATATIKTIK